MTRDMGGMVAVASGPEVQLHAWARVLRAAAITYHVTGPTYVRKRGRRGNAELWVSVTHVDEARSVIRSAEVPGGELIW